MEKKTRAIFFSLEKRNYKKNNIFSIKINDRIISETKDISKHIYTFYSDIYKTNYDAINCDHFIALIKDKIPQINRNFKHEREKHLTRAEMADSIKSMKKGKSPGSDGLTLEFYLQFWNLIEHHLFKVFCLCIEQGEMSTSMKQGAICLIPKPN